MEHAMKVMEGLLRKLVEGNAVWMDESQRNIRGHMDCHCGTDEGQMRKC